MTGDHDHFCSIPQKYARREKYWCDNTHASNYRCDNTHASRCHFSAEIFWWNFSFYTIRVHQVTQYWSTHPWRSSSWNEKQESTEQVLGTWPCSSSQLQSMVVLSWQGTFIPKADAQHRQAVGIGHLMSMFWSSSKLATDFFFGHQWSFYFILYETTIVERQSQ